MKVIRIKPGSDKLEVVDISSGLESLQHEVGGSIKAVYPWDAEVGLIYNEEGKMMDLDPCLALARKKSGLIYDVVCGTVLIVRLGEEDFTDLTDEQIEMFGNRLRWYPGLQKMLDIPTLKFVALTDVE